MLAGDNSILSRATDAKEKTTESQIKEEISIAWNGVQTEGMVNGWDIAKKAEELQKELKKEDNNSTATASGNNVNVKNYKGYDAVINTTNGSFTSFAKSNGDGGGDTGKLTLTATQRATESRAAVIEVSVGDIPTQEEWLAEYRTTNESEFNEIFAKSYGGPTATWANVSQNGTKTVDELYTSGPAPYFNNIYDFIIKQGFANDLYNSKYGATFTLNGEPITGASAEFVVTKNGSYTISAVQGEESGTTTIEVDKCKIEEYSSIQNSNYKLTKDGYEVWIPAGFAYGTSENVGTVTTGLVITDSVETVNGKNYSNGNEFVWIPVDKENLTVGKTTKAMATNIGTTENPNYRGVLYNWTSDPTGNTTITYSPTGNREPDAVSYYDTGDYSSYGITATTMQNDYNAMIASIKQYGGFYVGRYEMGDGAANISRIGVKPISAAENEANMWYGLYNKAKSYTTKTSVTAGMIWGSQYDAILNFALTNSSDSEKVNQSTNGNHTSKLYKTGIWLGTNNEADKINNIFDLEGNLFEWTKEALNAYNRVNRGGYLFVSVSPSYRYSVGNPNDTSFNVSSRLSLYINV